MKAAQPPADGVLGADLRVLATLYGLMIYHHQASLELAAQKPGDRLVIERWLEPQEQAQPQGACDMLDVAGCEACQ